MSNTGLCVLKYSKNKCYVNILKNYNLFFTRKKHYDIAIAGGGLVGTAMACALTKNEKLSDKTVILFESSSQKHAQKKSVNDAYSNRVVSLNPATKKFFESLDAWKHISDVRYKTVKKLQVWDACSDALITFNDDLINDVSYIVENDLIMDALGRICLDSKNVLDIKYESLIKNIELPGTNKSVVIEMENGDTYTCSLLIGADGANSQIRRAMNCHYLHWNYHQKGLVATLKLSEPTQNIVAWQRFLPTGPVALLPLTDELSSLVWSIGNEKAEELIRLSDESFVDAVNDAFWKIYPKNETVTSATNFINKLLQSVMLNTGSVRQLPPSISSVLPNSRAAFPLGFGYSSKYVAQGVALVGDAAHRVHPLAGQGVNLGFRDVESLTAKLADSVYGGNKLGSFAALKEYQSERQAQIVPMMMAIEFLQRLYSTEFTPVVLLRSLGLQVTNAVYPLKKSFISTGEFSRLRRRSTRNVKLEPTKPQQSNYRSNIEEEMETGFYSYGEKAILPITAHDPSSDGIPEILEIRWRIGHLPIPK